MPEHRPNALRDLPTAAWIAAAVVIVALAVILHALLPRYDFRVVDGGKAMIIYDRWSGQFQRAIYDAQGEPTLTRVLRPF